MSTLEITQSQTTDPRCWSFARRALAEKHKEAKRKPFWFWIELEYAGQKLGAFVNPYSSQSTIADTNYEAVVQILKLLVTPFMLKNYQPAVKVVLNEEDE